LNFAWAVVVQKAADQTITGSGDGITLTLGRTTSVEETPDKAVTRAGGRVILASGRATIAKKTAEEAVTGTRIRAGVDPALLRATTVEKTSV
jgi:hypothetical protein